MDGAMDQGGAPGETGLGDANAPADMTGIDDAPEPEVDPSAGMG